jgi:N-acyl-D-amino-acid deacylase
VSGSFDLIIGGGQVVDGTGAEAVPGDVGVVANRIAAVGDLTEAVAHERIDATGALVLPGFVDAHSHADTVLGQPEVQAALLCQGVTTVILGQDGISVAPSDRFAAGYADRYFAAVNGSVPQEFRSGVSVAELLDSYDRRGAVNAGYLVPAATVRARVIGLAAQRATDDQRRRMVDLVEEGLADGALGLSTGLDYVPGQFADTDELTALCRPVADARGTYVSHMRGYTSERAVDALEEIARIAAVSGVNAHVSHLHGQAALVAGTLDRIRRDRGVALSFDSYPYLRGSTILAMLLLPPQLQADGVDATLARLRDPSVRDELRHGWFPRNEARLNSIRLSFLGSLELRWAEGSLLREAAARWGRGDLTDFICDALITCDLAIGCVVDNGSDRTEDDMRHLLRRPEHMASSDAIFLGDHPHPRAWGAFARLLGRHVREQGDWTWGEAAAHLSGNAARRFGLVGRGLIADGQIADLVVLDPAIVADSSSYEDPRRTAVGVSHVVVSGEVALRDGAVTGARSGRALRGWDSSR